MNDDVRGIYAAILLRIALLTLIFLFAVLSFGSQNPAPAQQMKVDLARMSVPELLDRGDVLRASKAYPEALECYRIASAKAPKDSTVWNRRGITNLQMADYRTAKQDFKRAIKLNKNYAEAINNLGVTHYALKEYKKAIQQYEKALWLDEMNGVFHANLAAAWLARHQVERATAEYARAFELDQSIFERRAQSGITAHLSAPEDRAQYAYLLAKLYAKAGDYDRALAQLKIAREHGYSRLNDAYKDEEFAKLRKDARFDAAIGHSSAPGR